MKTNDLKKGTQVRLRNGNLADLMDNAKGNVRMARVYGQVEECGSIYSYDIVAYKKTIGDKWEWAEDIEYTPSQLKSAQSVGQMFGLNRHLPQYRVVVSQRLVAAC
jgi:hypothetical protein